MNKFVFPKLVNALLGFSDRQLRELKALLRRPRSGSAVIKQIDSILELRAEERAIRSSSNKRPNPMISEQKWHVDSAALESSQIGHRLPDNLRSNLTAILENRRLFPGTKDVIQVVNTYFNCEFDYATFRKRGRKDLIQRCWSHLESLPGKHRKRMIGSFIRRFAAEFSDSDAYRDLFKILTGNE